jgi:hypothetical protein
MIEVMRRVGAGYPDECEAELGWERLVGEGTGHRFESVGTGQVYGRGDDYRTGGVRTFWPIRNGGCEIAGDDREGDCERPCLGAAGKAWREALLIAEGTDENYTSNSSAFVRMALDLRHRISDLRRGGCDSSTVQNGPKT